MITESNDDSDKFCHCVFDLWRPLLLERMMSWYRSKAMIVSHSGILYREKPPPLLRGKRQLPTRMKSERLALDGCLLVGSFLFSCAGVRSPAIFSRASRIYQMMTRGDILLEQILLNFWILSLQRMYMWLHVRLCHRPDTTHPGVDDWRWNCTVRVFDSAV